MLVIAHILVAAFLRGVYLNNRDIMGENSTDSEK